MDEQHELISQTVSGVLFPEVFSPLAETMFLVATWYVPGRYWKVWRDQRTNREAAVEYAQKVLQNVRGHSHYTILELNLPGT